MFRLKISLVLVLVSLCRPGESIRVGSHAGAGCFFISVNNGDCPDYAYTYQHCHAYGNYQPGDMCNGDYTHDFPFVSNCNGVSIYVYTCSEPTMPPTAAPTDASTAAPSRMPTNAPTAAPRSIPTNAPTAPTQAPAQADHNLMSYSNSPTNKPSPSSAHRTVVMTAANTHAESNAISERLIALISFVAFLVVVLAFCFMYRIKLKESPVLPRVQPESVAKRCESQYIYPSEIVIATRGTIASACEIVTPGEELTPGEDANCHNDSIASACEVALEIVTPGGDCCSEPPYSSNHDDHYQKPGSLSSMHSYEPTLTDLYMPGSPPAFDEGNVTIQKIEAPQKMAGRQVEGGATVPIRNLFH
jgi:hypothetical protein